MHINKSKTWKTFVLWCTNVPSVCTGRWLYFYLSYEILILAASKSSVAAGRINNFARLTDNNNFFHDRWNFDIITQSCRQYFAYLRLLSLIIRLLHNPRALSHQQTVSSFRHSVVPRKPIYLPTFIARQ